MAKMSPMMLQYLETKEQYKDAILMFRLGDFYEMFFDDAILASKELNLVLTGKDCGLEERAPMCGIPYHAIETYLSKLVQNGHKVAIAEQMEDPKLSKGVVKREVIRVVTPGTFFTDDIDEESKNQYIASIYYDTTGYGISLVDFSTGEFLTTKLSDYKQVIELINRFNIKEILYNRLLFLSSLSNFIEKEKISSTQLEDSFYIKNNDKFLNDLLNNIRYNNVNKNDVSFESIISIYKYLLDTQKMDISHLDKVTCFSFNNNFVLDNFTIKNLELLETMRDKNRQGSLLWVLDKTKTAMGTRLLKKTIVNPFTQKEKIENRLDAIENFINKNIEVEEIRKCLNKIYDLERIITKICLKSANPKDLIAFKKSIETLPEIKNLLSGFDSKLVIDIYNSLDTLSDIYNLINDSLLEDAPLSTRDGNIFKDSFNSEIEKLRESKIKGKEWLTSYENEERQKTGIKALKIKYNRIFGYLFELTNANKTELPSYFIRKQTISNAERYSTEKLVELQDVILNSEDKLKNLEYELFQDLRDNIANNVVRIKQTAKVIALLDMLTSLSVVAKNNKYVRPSINMDGIISITNGRHPVVEIMTGEKDFIPNDTNLDNDKYIDIITGPNMAGKSTYMRQVALITLMAQIGSFVSASKANISIVDKIFTRVGASDDLSSGQSTFMVEMTELANILKFATNNSLLILDEIGRGTSTYDGMAIAWAVVEYINNIIKSKCFFATHYHELTDLEAKLEHVKNYNISVIEKENEIIFLRKIVEGAADKSYGIQVASLAGIPSQITNRANEILKELS